MRKADEPELLMDEDGIEISSRSIITPIGAFPLEDVKSVDSRRNKPLYGPLFLALLGTLNLLVAFQSGFWLDFAAAGVMLGAGIFWRTGGTKYVLTLRTANGEVDAWFARREAQVQRALEIIRPRLKKRPPAANSTS